MKKIAQSAEDAQQKTNVERKLTLKRCECVHVWLERCCWNFVTIIYFLSHICSRFLASENLGFISDINNNNNNNYYYY